ncbi:hypothetical protein [Salinibacterium sp. ZJ77]|uniref:hypothetical protein n=1 Tax=Salinibacterium sp. ZJ77 TaxID=2708337 RepID=UPI001424A353|nr:hypothetical protein [Salinibacterium sp. ZJ77]
MPQNSEPTPEVQDESGKSTIPPTVSELSDPTEPPAASRAAVLDEDAADAEAVDDGAAAPALVNPATPEPVTAEAVAATTEVHPVASTPDAHAAAAHEEPTRVVPPPAPVPASAAGHVAVQPTPPREVVYVQAPTPPKPRHNRGFGALVSLIGAVVFALVYLAVGGAIIALTPGTNVDSTFREFALSAAFWIPVAAYLVFSVLFALIADRASWWAHVLGSLLVALLTFAGSLGVLALMFDVPAMTSDEASAWLALIAVNPFLIAATLLARECALWFGLAIASRGRRVRLRNAEERVRFDSEVAEQRAAYERARPA